VFLPEFHFAAPREQLKVRAGERRGYGSTAPEQLKALPVKVSAVMVLRSRVEGDRDQKLSRRRSEVGSKSPLQDGSKALGEELDLGMNTCEVTTGRSESGEEKVTCPRLHPLDECKCHGEDDRNGGKLIPLNGLCHQSGDQEDFLDLL